MPDHEDLPGSRLSRLARLAGAGLRTGAGLLMDRDGSAAARAAAETLGTLRGLAAKVGQMASYVDGVVPEHHRDAFEGAMHRLRAAAPTSSTAEIRRTIENELGAPVDRLFSEFDDAPVASASIGQVHRARLPDGAEVAVKVQHPGVARALESDLANAGLLESMSGVLGFKRFDTAALFRTLRERFLEELDYGLEARRIQHFAAVHAGDPIIVVPTVAPSHSARRVLTTGFLRGAPFETACAAPEGERVRFAEAMWRFVYKGNTVGGMFNADPHPGNYVFLPDGRIAFLDYGCVQSIEGARLLTARELHRAALARDDAAFGVAAMAMVDARPGHLGRRSVEYLRRTFQPVTRSPFRVTRAFAAGLVEEMKSMALEARRADDAEFFTLPPEALFMNRLHFGFYSVLARLDVMVDYDAVERAFWPLVPEGGPIARVA
jgi:predicted unusual protein kinase regulating ubiquinone biosynthesis (AarF/ABC1/UbiB family)